MLMTDRLTLVSKELNYLMDINPQGLFFELLFELEHIVS